MVFIVRNSIAAKTGFQTDASCRRDACVISDVISHLKLKRVDCVPVGISVCQVLSQIGLYHEVDCAGFYLPELDKKYGSYLYDRFQHHNHSNHHKNGENSDS